jgi:hypothetical protein
MVKKWKRKIKNRKKRVEKKAEKRRTREGKIYGKKGTGN